MKRVVRTILNQTRNQSSAVYTRNNPFLMYNRYYSTSFVNKSGATLVAETGLLVKRGPNDTIEPITVATDLRKAIGILNYYGENELAIDATIDSANYCHKGDIDGSLLTLPAGVDFTTDVNDGVAGALPETLFDYLTRIGFFVVKTVTENAGVEPHNASV